MKKDREKSGVDLVGEAMHLLRTASIRTIGCYYVGTVPFVLGFLYFVSDMSRSAFAEQRCVSASLGLALLFLWMKSWHTFFARGLWTQVTHGEEKRMTFGRMVRTVAVQAAIQPYGLILIPVAFIFMIPFYSVHAFFQNVTVVCDGDSTDLKTIIQRSWRESLRWPRQNHIAIWLVSPWVLCVGMLVTFGTFRFVLSMTPELYELENAMWFVMALMMMMVVILPLCPFGCIVAGNIALLITVAPMALHSLLGIESVFTMAGWHGIFNTTFVVTVYGISYLCLDPIMKAAHVLRCFYGESTSSGADLLMELRWEEAQCEK